MNKKAVNIRSGVNPDVIDIGRLFLSLWQHAWLIVLSAVIFGGAAYGYAAYMITPLYKAKALMYVNNSSFSVGSTSFSISSSEITAAKSLVETYQVVLRTRDTLEEVIEAADLDYSYSKLLSMISTDTVENTEIFSVTVTSEIPEETELIANTITEILPGRIAEIIDGSSVRTVETAVVPVRKSSPNITNYTMKGILLGIFLSCAIICIRAIMDDVIHDEDYLMQAYSIPVLAVIPDLLDDKASDKYYSGYYGGKNTNGGTPGDSAPAATGADLGAGRNSAVSEGGETECSEKRGRSRRQKKLLSREN